MQAGRPAAGEPPLLSPSRLQARVELEEVEGALLGQVQVLDGARVDVADGAREGDGGSLHGEPRVGGGGEHGPLLDDLLVAPLHGAVAAEERDGVAVLVREELGREGGVQGSAQEITGLVTVAVSHLHLEVASSPHIMHRTCTSRWRARGARRMRKMGEPGTSPATCLKAPASSAGSSTLRMPLPPPPSDALIMSGKPRRDAAASAASAVRTTACA